MTFIKSDTQFKGVASSTFCVSKIVCLLIKYAFCYQKLSRIFIVFMHIMHAFQTLFLAKDELYSTLHCLWDFHYFLQCVIK